MKQSDIELIELAKQGNEQAFEKLYEQFSKLAYFFAYKLCTNEADAKDVVQETFIEIYRSISTLKENAYFKSWMYQIVNSKCKRLFRKNRYVTNDFEQEVMINDIVEERRDFVPEQFVHFHQDQDVLHEMINQLPEGQRAMVILFYLEQMSLKEISEILDLPIGTVKSRLSYARTFLKKAMMEYRKSSGNTLHFYEVDAVLVSLFASLLHQTAIPFMAPSMHSSHGIWKSLIQNTAVLNSAICMMTAVVLTSSVFAYQTWQKENNSDHPFSSQNIAMDQDQKQFEPVQIDQRIITSPQDGYFVLLQWACCEEMMKQKSEQEVQSYMKLYEQIKAYGGPFYDRLIQENWAISFETLKK